jgi:hypothetical protein
MTENIKKIYKKMNFITILSLFLIFSFQFSSLVSGGLIRLSESDSRLVKKNAVQNFFNLKNWDHKEHNYKEKENQKRDNGKSEEKSKEKSEEVTAKVTEETTHPSDVFSRASLICSYCG